MLLTLNAVCGGTYNLFTYKFFSIDENNIFTCICHAQTNPFLFSFEYEIGVFKLVGVNEGLATMSPPHIS